ncbi:cupin domain-containing protein [Alteribacillus iranensis]|uniref:Gentisate 1,2-dioxygenase n=1 Tax=Alteribacillus iranensis TaxID=930128 RepID=A0A1I2BCW6_9BACI|nr:cupin domain-containing protein [Alteribacillus iranensis]SFE53899.1 gentisate 1,2-dioxygenase [Alteribacillus iranensis]
MSHSKADFISYKDFLQKSTKPSVSPCIWKGNDIMEQLDLSLSSDFMGDGRGAVSLINKDTGDAYGVSPNINALVQVLKPGEHNNPHKHSNMALFIVFEGKGYSVIDGEKIEWEKGDVFFSPAWLEHEHCNSSDSENAILYTIQDVPTVSGMGAWFLEEPVGTKPQHVVEDEVTDKDSILPEK